MILTIFLFVIVFIVIAMLWTEGMWGNALTFLNTFFAAIVALNTYELAADWLDGALPSFTYLNDYLAVWLIFAIAYNLFRAVTDEVSKHKVRFKLPIEQTGRALFAIATAWIVICFVCTTLHMAPLGRTAFRGGFGAEPFSNHFVGFAPDRMMLGFMHSRSKADGALAWSKPQTFDPDGTFIFKYGSRRQNLQDYNALNGSVRVKK